MTGTRNFTLKFVQWPVPEQEKAVHEEISAAILNGTISVDPFISHSYPLEEYEAAFEKIINKEARKVVLTMPAYSKEKT